MITLFITLIGEVLSLERFLVTREESRVSRISVIEVKLGGFLDV